MSGTEEKTSAEQISADNQNAQPGVETNEENPKKMSTSEKMDRLLRGTSSEAMKKEIDKLRKESARYRVSSREETEKNQVLQERADSVQKELEALKKTHRELFVMRKLDKAGCVKSDLVSKDIPVDCEDIDTFIESYKEENGFLFKAQKQSLGGTFKPSKIVNLSPSQQMDTYIRSALGRN